MQTITRLLVAVLALLLTGCGLPAVAASPTSTSSALPAGFQPSGIAFWSESDGMIAGSADCPRCQVIMATTRDGGKSWTVQLHGDVGTSPQSTFVTTTYPGRGWVAYHSCAVRGTNRCPVELGTISDRGKTWPYAGPQSMAFSFQGLDGWAILGPDTFPEMRAVSLLKYRLSPDGMRANGTAVPTPCSHETLASVATLGPERAVLLCVGQPGIGMQGKDLYATADGGKTWSHLVSVPFGMRRPVHGLEAYGYPMGMVFLPDGHGWLWEERGALYASSDGGRTWRSLPVTVPESIEARSASFVSDRNGYVLLQNYPRFSMELAHTTDGGSTWHTVTTWATPRN